MVKRVLVADKIPIPENGLASGVRLWQILYGRQIFIFFLIFQSFICSEPYSVEM